MTLITKLLTDVQRAGPVIRLSARLDADGGTIELELPHGSTEARTCEPKQRVRVRPRHFSIFPRQPAAGPAVVAPSQHDADPGFRERERSRA